MRLAEKRALITGAASGIGAASARRFAAEGAAVVIADVQEESEAQVAAEIQAAGGKAHFLRADVTDREDCRRMVRSAAARLGGLDILFNNAISYGGDAEDESWDATLASGLEAVWAASLAAAPHLARNPERAPS